MVNTYITSFIKKYGPREGLILSELCQSQINAKDATEFKKQDCESILSFLSSKQIRTGITNLLKNGCVEQIQNVSFNRTAKYRIKQEILNHYMKSIIDNTKPGENNNGGKNG
jgi:hypothetical protein